MALGAARQPKDTRARGAGQRGVEAWAAKQGCKTWAVTGLRRGEGRSTLGLCLARLASQTGARIALVDADFENPQLAELLGVGTQCDWHSVLAEGLPLAEAAIVCLADELTLPDARRL